MNDKLKPCPFCGSEAKLSDLDLDEVEWGHPYYVTCTKCLAKIESPVYGEKGSDIVVENWNRRAEPETIVNNGTMTITM